MSETRIEELPPQLVAQIKAQGVMEAADWLETQANIQASKHPASYSGEHAAVRAMKGCTGFLRSWAINLTINTD